MELLYVKLPQSLTHLFVRDDLATWSVQRRRVPSLQITIGSVGSPVCSLRSGSWKRKLYLSHLFQVAHNHFVILPPSYHAPALLCERVCARLVAALTVSFHASV